MVKLAKKEEIEKSLEKAKKLEQKKEPYKTLGDLEKEDSWFTQQAKKLSGFLSRFPAKSKPKRKKSKNKKLK